jgi:hypothetical protein
MERARRKLAVANDGGRQMVDIPNAVLNGHRRLQRSIPPPISPLIMPAP